MTNALFLSIGSINADFQFQVDEDLSAGGTLPAKSFALRAGGKGANRAYFAQNIGIPARLIGCVGKDHFAEQALEPLRAMGMDLTGVTKCITSSTGISMIAVPEGGAKTILLAANANQDWDEASLTVLTDALADVSDHAVIALDFEISRKAVQVTLDLAERKGLRVVADGSFANSVQRKDLSKLCAIAPNVQEAATIAGLAQGSEEDAKGAALRLNEGGTKIVFVKLSDGGCLLATDGRVKKILAPIVEPVDKTGAGDAFTAALAVALLEGRSAVDAAIWGVAASTLAVCSKGSQEAYPSRAQLEEMVRDVGALQGQTR